MIQRQFAHAKARLRPLVDLVRNHFSHPFHLHGLSSCSAVRSRDFKLRCEPLEPRVMLAITTPVISEFMAINDTTITDGDGLFPDWVEVHNPTAGALDISGYHLTDNAGNLDKWEIPSSTILTAGEYRLFFASGQATVMTGDASYVDPGGFVHTNFALNGSGEFLALVDTDGETILHNYGAEYPPQLPDVSFGIMTGGSSVTLVDEAADMSYLVPSVGDAGLGTTWTEIGFDDSLWTDSMVLGAAGIVVTELSTDTDRFVEIETSRVHQSTPQGGPS